MSVWASMEREECWQRVRVYLYTEGSQPKVSFRPADLEHGHRPHTPHRGVRAWLERKLAHYKASWENARSPVVERLRAVWDWLHRWTYPDETFLVRLRSATSVEIAHDLESHGHAAKAWARYLKSRQRRHAMWFAFNVAVAPFTIVLAPLPGPNLIGYWFAYRAVHHGLIVVGLWRVRAGQVSATFHEADVEASRPDKNESEARGGEPAPADSVDAPAGSGS